MIPNTPAAISIAQTGTALSEPATILAPLFVIAVGYVLFYQGVLWRVGSDGWREARSKLLLLDDVASAIDAYTHYEIDPEQETVGELKVDVNEAVADFHDRGYLDAPIAAHKGLPDRRHEIASLAKYGFERLDLWLDGSTIEKLSRPVRFVVMLAVTHQRHVTLFETADGEDVLVTAHQEHSAHSVLYAYWHLRARGMDIDRGVREVVDELKEHDQFVVDDRARDLWLEWLKST